MGKIKIYKTLTLLLAMACFGSCDNNDIKDIPKVQEKLVLTASTNEITLTEENLDDVLVTFEWTHAREMSNDYIITYTTKLDIMGNNFGTSTMIYTDEEYGVFSKSYKGSQIAYWAQEKWGVGVNTPYTLQFRVVAQWEGGPTFEAPEVRQVEVKVNPIYVEVPEPFEADKVFIAGDAVGSTIELEPTLESEYVYAWKGNLSAGELQIPAELNGATYYVYPEGFDGTLEDGEKVRVEMWSNVASWDIPTSGEYRIVVDRLWSEVAIYSSATDLQPKVVEWTNAALEPVTTTITNLWMHGNINNWGAPVDCQCVVSLADPQILVVTNYRSASYKFIVYGNSDYANNSYAFGPEPVSEDTGRTVGLVLNEQASLYGGSQRGQRDSYFSVPAGGSMIVVDLRNMTVIAK